MTSQASPIFERFLHRLLSRSVLSGEEIGAILGLGGTTGHARVNEDIVQLGEFSTHACLVQSGIVGRCSQTSGGSRQITAIYIAGDMFDLQSTVVPRAATALRALAPTDYIRVPHAQLRILAGRHLGLAEAFWRDCVVDGLIACEWVLNVGRRTAYSAMAHLFCELGVRSEHAGLGSRTDFEMQINQCHLSDALGLTSVHVNRTLQALRREGVISLDRQHLKVPDWDRLARVADFDEAYLHLDTADENVRSMPLLRLVN